jgi:hypothetical protein
MDKGVVAAGDFADRCDQPLHRMYDISFGRHCKLTASVTHLRGDFSCSLKYLGYSCRFSQVSESLHQSSALIYGDQIQLFTVILMPQYTMHSAVLGALVPAG